jgi:hypothetical protein
MGLLWLIYIATHPLGSKASLELNDVLLLNLTLLWRPYDRICIS